MAVNVTEMNNRLWAAADQLRANSKLKSSEYAVPVLGLIFLRYADQGFQQVHAELEGRGTGRRGISRADYHARGVLYLPEQARFSHLLNLPEGEDLGKAINEAMKAVEAENEELKGVLPVTYQRLENDTLAALLKTFSGIPMDVEGDVFGRIYEYFLGKFAMAEGQRGGEFFTPTSLVRLMVEVIEPFHGRILDPACGSGGMFVQSARFVEEHQRSPQQEISIYGQEKVAETVRLCRMNLAVHGLSGEIKQANTYYENVHDCVGRFDFVLANPPFNVNGVDKEKVKNDPRYPFGIPRTDNANYLWIQEFYSALNERGRAGFVMANSASDARASEQEIRRKLIESGAVDVMVAIGSNFFLNVTLPCTLWFLDKGKKGTPREDTVLFIDARHIYRQVTRAHRDFTPEQLELIANIVRLYRGKAAEDREGSAEMLAERFPDGKYQDVPGLCAVKTHAEIEAQGWSRQSGTVRRREGARGRGFRFLRAAGGTQRGAHHTQCGGARVGGEDRRECSAGAGECTMKVAPPKGWEAKRLDELGFVGRGRSRHRPRNDSSLYGGEYPFFQTGDVKAADLYLTDFSQTYNEEGLAQSKLWKPGTVCITIAANIADTAILGVPGCFPDSIVGFVADPARSDPRFIKYYIDTIKLRMRSVSKGTTQDNLSLDKLLSFDFVVPDPAVQRRIAEVLSAYDELIENNTRRVAKLDNAAQAIFTSWFVDLRFPGHQGVETVEQGAERLPRGWTTRPITDVVDLVRGTEPGSKNYSAEPGDGRVPFIRVGDLAQQKSEIYVPLDLLSGKVLNRKDVVITLDGTVGIVRTGLEGGYSSGIRKAEIRDPTAVTRAFLLYALRSDRIQHVIQAHAKGTTILHAGSAVEYMNILLPSASLLSSFDRVVSPMLELAANLESQQGNLRLSRDLLLPKLISGEIEAAAMENELAGAAA